MGTQGGKLYPPVFVCGKHPEYRIADGRCPLCGTVDIEKQRFTFNPPSGPRTHRAAKAEGGGNALVRRETARVHHPSVTSKVEGRRPDRRPVAMIRG